MAARCCRYDPVQRQSQQLSHGLSGPPGDWSHFVETNNLCPTTRLHCSAHLFTFIIYFDAFTIGAIVMSFEMLGSRYLNPFFGSSIYTWAALISTVLAALTAGYFVGGVTCRPHGVGDYPRRHRRRRLNLFTSAADFC